MKALSRFRPTPALVVASVALLVALGGTGIAAVSVTLPRNSVGTLQLKNSAVTSAKIKNKAVGSSKLAGNSINSSKVLNRSLLAADFAPGQIPAGPAGPQGPAGPSGPSGPSGVAPPGYVAQVAAATSTSPFTTSSTSFVDLTGSDQTIIVPTGETARLYVWLNAESLCSGGTGYCRARITVDGTEIEPASGLDFSFDSLNDLSESHTMVRVSGTLAAGSHTVKAEVSTTTAATTFRLDDWAVVTQRVRLS